MTKDQWLEDTLKTLKRGIIQFGEYNFFDKGPESVLDYKKMIKTLKGLEPEVVGGLLEALNNASPISEVISNVHCKTLAFFLMEYLEEWSDDLPEGWYESVCNAAPNLVASS